jgi:hypothetical protein
MERYGGWWEMGEEWLREEKMETLGDRGGERPVL